MKETTKNWIKISDKDLEVSKSLFKNKYYSYAVFMAHQVTEKILKAVIQEITNETPLYTHNLALLMKQSSIDFTKDVKENILRLSPHYFATRYPEDIIKLTKQYNLQFTKKFINDVEEIIKWVKKNYLQ